MNLAISFAGQGKLEPSNKELISNRDKNIAMAVKAKDDVIATKNLEKAIKKELK